MDPRAKYSIRPVPTQNAPAWRIDMEKNNAEMQAEEQQLQSTLAIAREQLKRYQFIQFR